MRRLTIIISATLCSAFLLLLASAVYLISFGDISTASTSTLRSGRIIKLQNHGWSGYTAEDSLDTTRIKFADHVVTVAPRCVLVDSRKLATLDERVKCVAIDAQKDQIEFVADGTLCGSIRR